MLDLDAAPLGPLAEGLAPYLRRCLERAGAHALAIHADDVGPEHLLGILMRDEDSAAHQAVEHAFADPDLVAEEALAISSGLLVVASGGSRPFSTRLREACMRARLAAHDHGATVVSEDLLVEELCKELPAGTVEKLRRAGLCRAEGDSEGPSGPQDTETEAQSISLDGHLLRHFTTETKRALSRGCKHAHRTNATSLGPAHLLLALFEEVPRLFPPGGDGAARLFSADLDSLSDETPPTPRLLEADAALITLLSGLESGAGSLEVLLALHTGQTPELAQILDRHKLTPQPLQRARAAFSDPE